MVYTTAPDLVVLIGVRPVLSAVGLFLIVGGSWQAQRNKRVTTLKEQELTNTVTLFSSSTGPQQSQQQPYAAMADEDNLTSHSMDDLEGGAGSGTGTPTSFRSRIVCCSTLEIPFGSLLATLLGWFLFGLSCLSSPAVYDWRTLEGGTPIVCFVFCLLLACHLLFRLFFQKYDDLDVIIFQDEEHNAQAQSTAEITLPHTITMAGLHNIIRMVLLLILAALLGSLNPSLTGAVAALGGLGMGLSPYLASPRTVFHLQGPLLVGGAALLWLGMNAIAAEPNGFYLPVFFGSRTAVVIVGTFLILAAMWAVGYAQETDPTRQSAFGVHKLYFGALWEIRLALALAWSVFGIAVFLPYVYSAAWSTVLFLLYIALGYSMGMWYEFLVCTRLAQSSLAEQMNEQSQKWSRVAAFVLLLVVVFTSAAATYRTRPACIFLAFLGGALLVVGQVLLLRDSKIVGANFQQPHSYGSPLTALALILLGWAVSMPTG